MKPFQANLLCSFALIAFGLWAYFNVAPENRSVTILIPVIFGFVLATFTPALKREGKVASHLVAVLTLLITLMLIMPLKGSIGRDDWVAVFRVGNMMLFSVFALAVYINSFMQVRKAREQAISED